MTINLSTEIAKCFVNKLNKFQRIYIREILEKGYISKIF